MGVLTMTVHTITKVTTCVGHCSEPPKGWLEAHADLSGWAQALGGFLAIVAAVWLGFSQAIASENHRRREVQALAKRATWQAEGMIGSVQHAQELLGNPEWDEASWLALHDNLTRGLAVLLEDLKHNEQRVETIEGLYNVCRNALQGARRTADYLRINVEAAKDKPVRADLAKALGEEVELYRRIQLYGYNFTVRAGELSRPLGRLKYAVVDFIRAPQLLKGNRAVASITDEFDRYWKEKASHAAASSTNDT